MKTELARRILASPPNPAKPCTRCNGYGVRLYGNTSTWRHTIGGAAMTTDVCDLCWGSGDDRCPNEALRKELS